MDAHTTSSGLRPPPGASLTATPSPQILSVGRTLPPNHVDQETLTAALSIRRAVTERTGLTPHTICLLAPGSLPRTSSGKLRRQEALRRFQAGTLAPPRRVGALGLALEVARSKLAPLLGQIRSTLP